MGTFMHVSMLSPRGGRPGEGGGFDKCLHPHPGYLLLNRGPGVGKFEFAV